MVSPFPLRFHTLDASPILGVNARAGALPPVIYHGFTLAEVTIHKVRPFSRTTKKKNEIFFNERLPARPKPCSVSIGSLDLKIPRLPPIEKNICTWNDNNFFVTHSTSIVLGCYNRQHHVFPVKKT